MIKFTFYKNKSGELKGFECINHGRDIVCAAVSILTQNTVNSVEALSDTRFKLNFSPEGGFMELILTEGIDNNAEILLKSLELGIGGIAAEYSSEIEVFVKEV